MNEKDFKLLVKNIEDEVGEIKKASTTLTLLSKPKITTAIENIKNNLKKLKSPGAVSPPGDFSVTSAAPKPDKDKVQISDFFKTVGEGMVSAQKHLDDESLKYNAGPKVTLPSIFRIPKASAEIKFGLKEEEGTKFNVFVYGSKESTEQTQQHKVSFDIVSAPPPVEIEAKLGLIGMNVNSAFVTSIFERAKILDAVKGTRNKVTNQKLKPIIDLILKPKSISRLLILRTGEFKDKDDANINEHALILPERLVDDTAKVDIVYLTMGKKQNKETFSIKEAPEQPLNKPYKTLLKILLNLSNNQAEILNNLKGKK